ELIEESVLLHMVSDVPVGAFLSGGIDSSAVVAQMVRLASDRVSTFSIGFTEGDYNELPFARMLANRLGTEHHELVLEPNVLEILEDLTWHLDEPLGDPSVIPTYMVSKLAAQHGKVVLSGDGGDELFAGYDKYAVEGRERNYDMVPAPVRKLLGGLGEILPEGAKGRNFLRHIALTGAARRMDASSLFRPEEKKRLFQEQLLHQFAAYDPRESTIKQLSRTNGNWLSSMQYQDLKRYLPMDILVKVDRMSMAHSLEVRPPLLDHKLVEFAATIPPELMLRGGTRKYIFKRAMRGILPDAIIDRPKRGFAIPLGRWFRGKLADFLRDLLLSDTSRRRGIFRPAYIEHLLGLHKKGRDLDFQLWTLISFEMWCRVYLDCTARKPDRWRLGNSRPLRAVGERAPQ
ncbi:MAG: asparagine synthetase B, partial [Acidobacteria bacterium]